MTSTCAQLTVNARAAAEPANTFVAQAPLAAAGGAVEMARLPACPVADLNARVLYRPSIVELLMSLKLSQPLSTQLRVLTWGSVGAALRSAGNRHPKQRQEA